MMYSCVQRVSEESAVRYEIFQGNDNGCSRLQAAAGAAAIFTLVSAFTLENNASFAFWSQVALLTRDPTSRSIFLYNNHAAACMMT